MFWVLSLASYQAGERPLSRGAGTRWSPLWVCMGSHYSHNMVTGVKTGSDISSVASREAEGAKQVGLHSRPALSLSSVAKPTSLTRDQALPSRCQGKDLRGRDWGWGEGEGSFQETSKEEWTRTVRKGS